MTNQATKGRTILRITGGDRSGFLQGLVTNDVGKAATGLVYAALLTPQGKYLADFFFTETGDHILLDVATSLAADVQKRLTMYRLRADVAIEPTDLGVTMGTGPKPDGALDDPRHAALGWRLYGEASVEANLDAIRVAHCIPASSVELIPNDSFILEAGFDRLNGVDFRKGCYVGQEVTARMRHKTTLRKGLVRVDVDGQAPVGTEITADGKPAGVLYSQSGGQGIAYLRFDRANGPMQAGDAVVRWQPEDQTPS